MHRLAGRLVLVAPMVLAGSGHALAQVVAVPVALELSASTKEVQTGTPVTFTVTLRNARGEPVPALIDTPVTLSGDTFDSNARVIIPKGHSSAAATITLTRSAIGLVKGVAAKLSAAYTLVPVRPAGMRAIPVPAKASSREELLRIRRTFEPLSSSVEAAPNRASAAVGSTAATPGASRATALVIDPQLLVRPQTTNGGGGGAPAAPSQAGPLPNSGVGSPESGPALALDVQVIPEEIHPRANTWTADVTVILLNKKDDTLASLERDLPVELSTRFGEVSPREVIIRAGESSTASSAIHLVADRVGEDVVRVLSTIAGAERHVVFTAPPPAKVRIDANPSEVLNDGRTIVNVSILLLDADDHPTTDDSRDIELLLTSSLGELETRTPKILRGTFSAETTLTSARHGTAHISASAVGLDGGTGQAVFTFPWLMTGLAVAGGIAGSFARQTGSRGRKKLTPHLIIGAIFGLAFYALVMLGAVASVPKFSIAIGNIATVNELGALVLGLIGGYGGKHLWEHLTSA